MNAQARIARAATLLWLAAAITFLVIGCDSAAPTIPPSTPASTTAANPTAAPQTTVAPLSVPPTSAARPTDVPTAAACTAPGVAENVSLNAMPGTVSDAAGIAWLAGRTYVTGRSTANLGVIEGEALTRVEPLGQIPTLLAADSAANRLYAVINNARDIAVLEDAQVRATIPLSNPQLSTYHQVVSLVVDSAHNRLLAGIEGTNTAVAVISTQSLSVVTWIPFGGYRVPLRLVLSPDRARVYAVSDQQIEEIDIEAGRVTRTIPLGSYSYGVAAIDPASSRLFVDQYDSQKSETYLAVVENGRVSNRIALSSGSGASLALGRRLYVAASISNTVDVIDLDALKPVAQIPVGLGPTALAADATGAYLYVTAGRTYGQVYVIDTRTNTVARIIPLNAQPKQLLADAARSRLFALMPASSEVLVTNGRQVLASIPVERAAGQMALDASSGRLYVTDLQTNNLLELDVDAGRVSRRLNVPLLTPLDAVTVDGANKQVIAGNRAFALSDLAPAGIFSITMYGLPSPYTIQPAYLMADAAQPRIYALASNGIPGSNGGIVAYAIDSNSFQVLTPFGNRDIRAMVIDSAAQHGYLAGTHPIEGITRLYAYTLPDAKFVAELPLLSVATALALNPRTQHLFIARVASDARPHLPSLDVLDTRSLGTVTTLPLDADPVALTLLGDRVFIAYATGHSITVVRDCATAQPDAPTPTPSPTPYVPPTAAPSATPIPARPSPTAAPRATPTVAASAACRIAPAAWVITAAGPDFELRANLGCPSEAARTLSLGRQMFQKGVMIWRADNRKIIVIYNNGSWAMYDDTWDESQPVGGTEAAPSGMRAPKRGFGKLWRERLGGGSGALGWALADETGLSGSVQAFDRGLALSAESPESWLLLDSGTWR